MPIDETSPDYVTALERGLAVLTLFGPGAEVLSLSEVATKAGLTRGTARRFLLTLEALGYVRQDAKRFSLTPKTLTLGYSYLSSMPIGQIAQRYIKDVVDEIDESCSMGVLDGLDVVYVARVPPRHFQFIPMSVGARLKAHVSAMGRVLLAELAPAELDAYFRQVELTKICATTDDDEQVIRDALQLASRDGYALADQQLQQGRRAIAVPIRVPGARAYASLNASADASRATTSDLLTRFLPALRRAADSISHAMETHRHQSAPTP